MEKAYRLFFRVEDQFAYITDVNISFDNQMKLMKGQKLESSSFKADVKRASGLFPDVMGRKSIEPLISERFKEVLLQVVPEEQIQLIPVEVASKTYWLLNVLNNIPCFDWDLSEYTTYTSSGALRRVQKGVLKTEMLEGIDIFRVTEHPGNLFISGNLKNRLEENQLTGINIVKNDNWDQNWND